VQSGNASDNHWESIRHNDGVRIPSELRLEWERNDLERPSSRDSRSRVHIIASPFKARNARRPTRRNHSPSRPHCPSPSFFFSFPSLVSHFQTTLPLHHAADVRSFLYLVLALPLYAYISLFNHHSRHPRGCHYYTKLRLADRYCMYIRPPFDSSKRASSLIEKFPSFPLFFSSKCFPLLLTTVCGTVVRTISGDPSRAGLILLGTVPLSPVPGRRFHSRSIYLRYISE
jgi:hypothetical protein